MCCLPGSTVATDGAADVAGDVAIDAGSCSLPFARLLPFFVFWCWLEGQRNGEPRKDCFREEEERGGELRCFSTVRPSTSHWAHQRCIPSGRIPLSLPLATG